MKEVVILSGKGGTGKTSIAGSLAALAKRKVLADCDVDAADFHLLLSPFVKEETEFWSGQVARIDPARCTECGLCQDLCRFEAIRDYQVDPISCEGCGFCFQVCPASAITMKENLSGHWFVSDTRYGPLVHARLGIAQENSGKLVAQVRKLAQQIAREQNLDYIVSDGPPGIGCPVISSLSGADLALVIAEPTFSGLHDMERVLGVCRHFGIPAVVCINKCDLNEDNTRWIEGFAVSQDISVVSKIPFDNTVTEALVHGVPVVEYADSGAAREIMKLWDGISRLLEHKGKG
jgi:MinD superfamily P-loop ATPase